MSGRHDNVMEDKFATKAVSFKNKPVDNAADWDSSQKLENLNSDIKK